jgi:D-alanyl-D-alanine carboxypeptidase/D-alanyl-D-alanine-endopeptidase (penicillin-binding protein 4)
MVMSLSRGDTLFSRNAEAEMRPASTMKLFTSALAFDHFGTEHQFSTDVLRNGPVSPDGTLHGDIIIRGDGDPALAPRFIDGGPNAPMETLAQQVATAGIKRITGSVIGDGTGFDDQKVPAGWLTRYLGASYAARVSALSLDENVVWVAVGPGSGGSAAVSLEPATTTLSVINHARTVSGSGVNIHTTKHPDGTIEVRGSIGRSAGVRRYSYVVDDPALFAAGAFGAALAAKGVHVDGQVRLGPTPAGATMVTSLASPTLARMVSAMNRESINHYAELLFRDAARGPRRSIQGSAAVGNHSMRLFLKNAVGVDTSAIYNADGSGLSTEDHVTAQAMVQLLCYAHTAPWGPAFHASMPLAGESGTQRKRMRGGPAQGNLHAKTGTTNDVIALAGYVTALDGEVIAFAFLYNGRDRWTAKSTIDIMGETLASFAR